METKLPEWELCQCIDIPDYPLKNTMTAAEIKAVPGSEVLKGAMKVAVILEKRYEGTPWYLDMSLSTKVLTFITLLKHTGGSLGGTPFRLLPFQAEFVLQSLCVMARDTGFRKHKECIMSIPRKNGKTEQGAGFNLWMLFGDGEPQKELYSIASETQQAAILYGATQQMLKNIPALLKRSKTYLAEKKITSNSSDFVDLYRVLSAVAGTKDGLKTSTVFADEPHAYPDSALYDVVTEGMAHRDQPLAFLFSTAGYNKQGFYHRKLLYARKVMKGIIKDDSIYLMDFSLEDDEDWTDEKNWRKVNPALGFGVKMAYLRDKYHKALHSATDEVSFKTKHLNMWVDSAVTWLRSTDWNASVTTKYTEEDLAGRECYAGLDLASTTDLAVYVLVFPMEDKTYRVLCRFFVPKDNAALRAKVDRVSYLDWIREGYITATPGNVIDYDVIEENLLADNEKFDIRELAFDRWNSHALINNVEQQGMIVVGFGQGFKSMSSPIKEIEALVLQKRLDHGDNPVLNWNISNCVIIRDPADNVKLDKSKAQEKIDGAVALAMAVGRASVHVDDTPDIDSLIA